MMVQALIASLLVPLLVPSVPPPPPPTTSADDAIDAFARHSMSVREPTASGDGVSMRNGVPVSSLGRAAVAAVPSLGDEDGVTASISAEPVPPLAAPPLRGTARVGPTQTVDGPLSLSATRVFLASSAVMPHEAPTLRVRGAGSSIQLGLPVASLRGKDVLVECAGKFPEKLHVGVVWVSWDGAVKAWNAMILDNLGDRAKFVISPAELPPKGKLWIQLRQLLPDHVDPQTWEITQCSATAIR